MFSENGVNSIFMIKNSKIKKIKAREILDSRGNPTVEVELSTEEGVFFASVPSGASKGKYETPTVSVQKAVKNINEIISPNLKGKDPGKQKEIDNFLDPVKFGANTTTGVSMAVCRAGAAAQGRPLYRHIAQFFRPQKTYRERVSVRLPRPAFNIINGGAHADNDLDFQEFMIVPQASTFRKALFIASEIYQELRKKLGVNVGDEGGFAPPFKFPEQALDLISKKNIKIVLDIAASQFFKKGNYKMKIGTFTPEGLINCYQHLIQKYPIIAIEDPFAENDWQGFQTITKKFGKKITIIGDDLLATNPKRIKEARNKKACNGLLLKVNQIGTITETIEAAKMAKSYGWKIMVSHRSGETNDDFISDLAVGLGADFIKAGAPARGERVAKYNRLLQIENQIYQ